MREGFAPSLGRLSRELDALGYAKFQPEYELGRTFTTHGNLLKTTAVWGDRTRKTVETYERQAPREVWLAQQLFLGLLAEISWERQSRKQACDFEKVEQ